jgi:hypothetical protein
MVTDKMTSALIKQYMVDSFGIDTITSYLKGVLPATFGIVNPEYRELIAGQKKVSKIIAYRAETAMVNRIKKQMANPEQARSLIRKFYRADAVPDSAQYSARFSDAVPCVAQAF